MTTDPFARAKVQRALKGQVEAGRAVVANVRPGETGRHHRRLATSRIAD